MTLSSEQALRIIDLTILYPVTSTDANGQRRHMTDVSAQELMVMIEAGAVECIGTHSRIRRARLTCSEAEAHSKVADRLRQKAADAVKESSATITGTASRAIFKERVNESGTGCPWVYSFLPRGGVAARL